MRNQPHVDLHDEGVQGSGYLSNAYPSYFSFPGLGEDGQDILTLISYCVVPSSLVVLFEFLLPLIAANIALKILLANVRSGLPAHVSTVIVGLASVAWHLRDHVSHLVVVMVHAFAISMLACRVTQKRFVWIASLSSLLLNEAVIYVHPHHVRIRTHLMLLTMKFVSWSPADGNGIMPCLSYALHPMSLVLGSWHPPITGHASGRYMKSVSCLLCGIVALLASNCMIQFLVTEFVEPLISFKLYTFLPESVAAALHKFLISYFVALQFRSSHYFICFTTEASFSFWGSNLQVARPSIIELPRSLVDVVISWNIPFHLWIRRHVFKPLKQQYGGTVSVLLTYCVSSLLHGLNFQIFSVLFSLGCLTLLEFRLRHKLSLIFNACMMSKKCPSDCGHYVRNRLITNFLFSIVAMIHLSFLGSAFDGKEDSSDMKNVLIVWSSLAFYSPILALITFSLYLLI